MYLFGMLPFRMIFSITCFALFLFHVILQYFSFLTIFVIYNEIIFAVFFLSIVKDSLDKI